MGAGQDHPEWQGLLDEQEKILWQARPFGGFLSGIRRHRAIRVWAVILLIFGTVVYITPPFATTSDAINEERMLRLTALGLLAMIWAIVAVNIGIRHASRFYTLTTSHAYIGEARLITIKNLAWSPYVDLEKSLNYYEFKPDTAFCIKRSLRNGRSVQHLFASHVTDQSGKIYDKEIYLFQNAPTDQPLEPILERVSKLRTEQ